MKRGRKLFGCMMVSGAVAVAMLVLMTLVILAGVAWQVWRWHP